MFEFFDGYDVQATRKQAREEDEKIGRAKIKKEYAPILKKYKDEIKRLEQEIAKYETANKISK